MALSKSFIRNAAAAPLDARLMNMAGIVSNADGTPRVGVLGAVGPSIVSTTATMNVSIATAGAEFATSKGKADGVAIFTNDGIATVAISAAPVSNSRWTIVWVKHEDNTTGDAASLPIFGTTDGAAAASPTAPAIPTGALELARLQIFSGTTATNGGANTLTNTYRMTAARGGTVPVRTIAERDAWTAPLPVAGQVVQVLGTSQTFQYVDGTIGWLHVGGKPDTAVITSNVAGGITAGTPAPRLVIQNGRVNCEGRLTSASTAYVAGTTYGVVVAGGIPAAYAPKTEQRFIEIHNFTFYGELIFGTDGSLTWRPAQSATLVLSLNLDGFSWPLKTLV